jgi:hypothetical protein
MLCSPIRETRNSLKDSAFAGKLFSKDGHLPLCVGAVAVHLSVVQGREIIEPEAGRGKIAAVIAVEAEPPHAMRTVAYRDVTDTLFGMLLTVWCDRAKIRIGQAPVNIHIHIVVLLSERGMSFGDADIAAPRALTATMQKAIEVGIAVDPMNLVGLIVPFSCWNVASGAGVSVAPVVLVLAEIFLAHRYAPIDCLRFSSRRTRPFNASSRKST